MLGRRCPMFGMTPWRQRRADRGLQTRNDDPAVALRREFDSLLDNFFSGRWPMGQGNDGWGMDIEDEGKEYVVHAEAPGFEAGDFDVQVAGDLVTVKAERKQESKQEGSRYRSYERTFTLPSGATP